jgi:hypothetical protein
LSAAPDDVQGQFIRLKTQKRGLKRPSRARLAQNRRVFDSLILMTRQPLPKEAEFVKTAELAVGQFWVGEATDETSLLRFVLKLKSLFHEK